MGNRRSSTRFRKRDAGQPRALAGTRLAIFASGAGSNACAIFDAVRDGRIGGEVAFLVCDRAGAPVIQKALDRGIPVLLIDANWFPDRDAYERDLIARLDECGVGYVVLAGYMRICGPVFLERFAGRAINLHPSLLPAFPGRDAIGQAFDAGVPQTGVTVHFIDEGVDSGPIIAQREVAVLADDSIDSLRTRIQAVEHQLLPAVTADLVAGRLDRTGTPQHLQKEQALT